MRLYRPLGRTGLPNVLLALSAAQMRVDPTSDSAAAHAREALALNSGRSHHLGMANAELQLGRLAILRSDCVSAESHLKSSLNLYRQLDEPLGLGNALRRLAQVRLLVGDFAEADRLLTDALSLTERGR